MLLGVLRVRAQWAALAGPAVSIAVAVVGFAMPVGQSVPAATHGAFFGLSPILWIVVNALWVYNMTVVTGHFDVLRRSFGALSSDRRTQAILVAFCVGGLLEALAGFGAPVAITSVMLMALGFKPIKTAVPALVANTAPVAFGAMGVPVITLARVSGLPAVELRWAILTVASVLALAYVMNASAQTTAIGMLIAGAGGAPAFLSAVLGWFAVAVTGSDTSANALFGSLQVTAANGAGLPPDLLAAANSSGGVLGKMLSPQNLTIAAVAVRMEGEEGTLLRKVIGWSVGMLVVLAVIIALQATPVLGWMLP